MAEQVGGSHADAQAGLLEPGLEARHDAIALGRRCPPRDEIVVVQRHAPRPKLGELLEALGRVERSAGRVAERVAAWIADGPEAERETALASHRHLLPRSSGSTHAAPGIARGSARIARG